MSSEEISKNIEKQESQLMTSREPVEEKHNEGWNWIYNSPKWHYFVDGKSLCKRWMLFSTPKNLEQGNNNSPDNCKLCRKTLEKRLKNEKRTNRS